MSIATCPECGDRFEMKSAVIEAEVIRLAHPDKHAGSASATEASQWLLQQRQARR